MYGRVNRGMLNQVQLQCLACLPSHLSASLLPAQMYAEVPALSQLPAAAAEEVVLNAALNSKASRPCSRNQSAMFCPSYVRMLVPAGWLGFRQPVPALPCRPAGLPHHRPQDRQD